VPGTHSARRFERLSGRTDEAGWAKRSWQDDSLEHDVRNQ
jgi:hypothetical protein